MPKNKYHILAELSLISWFLLPMTVEANSIWQAAGSDGGYISAGAGYETDINTSDAGVVYAAFEDKKNSKRARVRKLTESGWIDLADSSNPLGLISSSWGHKPILVAKGSEVYVAFSDQANGNRARVKKWDGSQWSYLSDSIFLSGFVSFQAGYEPELSFDKAQNYLYIAFQDTANSNRVKVMRWNGSDWSAVADENYPDGLVSSGAGAEVAITSSKVDNSIYIVYEDVLSGLRLRVKKWDGSNWSDVTDSAHPAGLITSTPGYSPVIASDSQDRIYVVYTYKKEGNTYIQYWNGVTWGTLGSGKVIEGKSIESTVLVDNSDNIFVAMSQLKKVGKQKKSWRVRVRKWNGQKWVDVSDSTHRQGFLSKKGKGDPATAVADGKIYIIFTDYSSRRRARALYFDSNNVP